MHIHDIEAFLTVVQTRNISRAAEQLYVSQTLLPTVCRIWKPN